MSNPVFWLGLSVGLLAVSILVLLVLAIPILVGLARTARSAEHLLETLNRELPATLKALRQTGADLGNLADDVTSTTHSARQIVTHVDRSVVTVQQQARQAQRTSRSLWAGTRAAWRILTASPSTQHQTRRTNRKRRKYPPTPRPSIPVTRAETAEVAAQEARSETAKTTTANTLNDSQTVDSTQPSPKKDVSESAPLSSSPREHPVPPRSTPPQA